jgi:hypothetical protein
MRKKDNGKARPRSDRRIAAGGNDPRPILKGNFGRVCRICNQCVEWDAILHRDARDTSMESLWICQRGRYASDQQEDR